MWTENIKNTPKYFFSHLWPPYIFLKNSALSLLYPCSTLTSWSLRYSKTNQPTERPRTDRQTRVITKDPLGRTRGRKSHLDVCSTRNIQMSYWFFEKNAQKHVWIKYYFYFLDIGWSCLILKYHSTGRSLIPLLVFIPPFGYSPQKNFLIPPFLTKIFYAVYQALYTQKATWCMFA